MSRRLNLAWQTAMCRVVESAFDELRAVEDDNNYVVKHLGVEREELGCYSDTHGFTTLSPLATGKFWSRGKWYLISYISNLERETLIKLDNDIRRRN